MSNEWLEIPNSDIDQEQITDRVQARLEIRLAHSDQVSSRAEDIAETVWYQVLGYEKAAREMSAQVPLQMRDCDIVPRTYQIGWQNPILGPIYAYIRRIINGEIRRFLGPSLEHQSALNRQFLRLIQELRSENQRLTAELADLKKERP